MSLTLIVTISAFVGVAALVGGVAMLVRGATDNVAEDRLGVLTGKAKGRKQSEAEATVISKPLDDVPGALEEFFSRFLNISLLLEQANLPLLTTGKFVLISACPSGPRGVHRCLLVHRSRRSIAPLAGHLARHRCRCVFAVMAKGRRRRKAICEAACRRPLNWSLARLRAGHSLGSGFSLGGQ